jgi:hypothetical protein
MPSQRAWPRHGLFPVVSGRTQRSVDRASIFPMLGQRSVTTGNRELRRRWTICLRGLWKKSALVEANHQLRISRSSCTHRHRRCLPSTPAIGQIRSGTLFADAHVSSFSFGGFVMRKETRCQRLLASGTAFAPIPQHGARPGPPSPPCSTAATPTSSIASLRVRKNLGYTVCVAFRKRGSIRSFEKRQNLRQFAAPIKRRSSYLPSHSRISLRSLPETAARNNRFHHRGSGRPLREHDGPTLVHAIQGPKQRSGRASKSLCT